MTVIFEIFVLSIFTYNFCDAQYSGTFGNRSKKPSAYPSAPYSGRLQGGSSIYDSKNLDTVNSEIKSLKENYYSLLHESQHQKEILQHQKETLQHQKETLQENYNSLKAEMQVNRENLTLMRVEITSMKEETESSTTEKDIATTTIMPIDIEATFGDRNKIPSAYPSAPYREDGPALYDNSCIRVIEFGSEKYFTCTEGFSYVEAREFCKEWGSHLAEEIDDPPALEEKLRSTLGHGTYWIGAHRDADGVFKWTKSGTIIPKESPYWFSLSTAAFMNCVLIARFSGKAISNSVPCKHNVNTLHPLCKLK